MASHVAGCPACQARAAHLRSTVLESERLYRVADESSFPATTGRTRLERALQQAGEAWDRSWWTRWRHRASLAPATLGRAVAASLAVVAVTWIAGATLVPRLRAPRPAAGSALPMPTLTPGAVSTLTAAELCAGNRSSRTVTDDVRRRVLARYGMEHMPARSVRSSTRWSRWTSGGRSRPRTCGRSRYASSLWNAHVKDALERLLAHEVCEGRVPLSQAQREIATDWVAAYKRRFHTDTPMPDHARSTEIDDDLEFEPPAPVRTVAGSGDASKSTSRVPATYHSTSRRP